MEYNDNSNKGEKNTMVPLKMENFDKSNKSFVNKHQMSNKEYYMLNKVTLISNELKNGDYNERVEATLSRYNSEINNNNKGDKRWIDDDSSIQEIYKYKYFAKEAIDTTNSLKVTELLPIEENAFNILPNEYSYWGWGTLCCQSNHIICL